MSLENVMKQCNMCMIFKSILAFTRSVRNADGRKTRCRQCLYAVKKDYLKRTPIKRKKWQRMAFLKQRYGIRYAEFEAILAKQGNRCAICRTEKAGGRWNRFNVDHDHTTGKIRGLLCHNCNSALAKLGDTEESIHRVMAYVSGQLVF